MKSLQNKVVWITGASSGIGEALAHAFASEGCKLVLSSRRADELKRVSRELKISAENIFVLPFDIADYSQCNEWTRAALSHFGSIDILVNNAGVSQRSLVKDTSIDIDKKIMDINYFGTIALTKAVLPHMIKNKSGHILVMSSIAGKFGFFLRSAYSASKHALHGFFEALRMELHKENIKVTIACPGKVRTDISKNALTEKGEKHNIMDAAQEKGITAEKCARIIVDAVKKDKFEVYAGGKELRAVWIKRFFPSFFTNAIRKVKVE